MATAAYEASMLLKALANPHRLAMMCALIDGERSVGEIAEAVGLRQPNVSQHLTLLRKDGLVEGRRDGQTVRYRISSPQALAVLDTLPRIYCTKPPACPAPRSARPAGGRRRREEATR
jgi:DNA-binding transcriptional ArsR family regulator